MTCPCGNPLDIRARFGRCRKCRARERDNAARKRLPVTLADQLVVWAVLRAGDSMDEAARITRRLPTEARRIAYGEP